MKIDDVIGDKAAQAEGEWIEFKPGISFKLIFSAKGKPRDFFQKGLSKLRQKHRGNIPFDKQQDLTLEMLYKLVVLDWKGWEQDDPENPGQSIPFPYSRENCQRLLTDSTVIRDFVAEESCDIENFGGKLDADEEDTAKGAMKSSASLDPRVREK